MGTPSETSGVVRLVRETLRSCLSAPFGSWLSKSCPPAPQVVNTDPNFVPLDRWPEWRYLLDLPGNGYSGSLKQKLTSTSAVLLLTDMGVEGASPVYEHYHGGLQHQARARVACFGRSNLRVVVTPVFLYEVRPPSGARGTAFETCYVWAKERHRRMSRTKLPVS